MDGVTQKTELARLLRQIEVARKELEALVLQKSFAGNMTERISVLTKEKNKLQSELEDFGVKARSNSILLNEMDKEIRKAKQKLSALEENIMLRERRISSMDNSQNNLTRFISEKRDETHRLNQAINALTTKLRNESEACRSLSSQKEEWIREAEKLKAVLNSKRAEVSLADAEIAIIGKRRKVAESEVEVAKRTLLGVQAETKRIEEQNEQMRQMKADGFIARDKAIQVREDALTSKEEQFSQRERLLGDKVLRLRIIKQTLQSFSAQPIDVEI